MWRRSLQPFRPRHTRQRCPQLACPASSQGRHAKGGPPPDSGEGSPLGHRRGPGLAPAVAPATGLGSCALRALSSLLRTTRRPFLSLGLAHAAGAWASAPPCAQVVSLSKLTRRKTDPPLARPMPPPVEHTLRSGAASLDLVLPPGRLAAHAAPAARLPRPAPHLTYRPETSSRRCSAATYHRAPLPRTWATCLPSEGPRRSSRLSPPRAPPLDRSDSGPATRPHTLPSLPTA